LEKEDKSRFFLKYGFFLFLLLSVLFLIFCHLFFKFSFKIILLHFPFFVSCLNIFILYVFILFLFYLFINSLSSSSFNLKFLVLF
jgi:hypothetical protein